MTTLLPFALILVAFYFLILRPQRARAKAAQQLQGRLAPGVEVMTTSGIYGTVTEIRDDSVVLEVAPGSTLRVTKAAVGRVLVEDTSATDVDLDDSDDTDAATETADAHLTDTHTTDTDTADTDLDDSDLDAGAGRRSPSAD